MKGRSSNMKLRKIPVFALVVVMALGSLSACATTDESADAVATASADASGNASGDAMGMPEGEMPPGPPPGGPTETVTTYRCKEEGWSFQLVVTESGDAVSSEAILTGWDTDTTVSTLVIPSVLGGAEVTTIESTAVARANNVTAVYIPQSVTTIKEFAFYDLNGLEYISSPNAQVDMADGALASCNSAEVTNSGETIGSLPEDISAYAVAPGVYVYDEAHPLTQEDLDALTVKCEGDSYEVKPLEGPVIFEEGFVDDQGNDVELTAADFKYNFRNLSDEKAYQDFVKSLEDGGFAAVAKGLDGYDEPGYYLNGSRVALEENVALYDAKTGETLPDILSTGGAYAYAAYRDYDNDGEIDALYYTDGVITDVLDQDAVVVSDHEILNGKGTAKTLEGKYFAFVNAVVSAHGREDVQSYETLEIKDTADATYIADGNTQDTVLIEANTNQERDLIWADDYGVIEADYVDIHSTSYANWAKETFEAGDSSYNYEVNMQFGLNAAIYATSGGQVRIGTADGQTSKITTNGDTGNGVIAIGGGTEAGSEDAPYPSSAVSVTNAEFVVEGWNSHVVDCIYGGYVQLDQVTGVTGIKGSYLGQSSALANDFGAGVIEAKDSDFTTYGNGSAGAYVIGQDSGVIKTENTNFTSQLDSALCTAGGRFDITGGTAKGIIALRARASGNSSDLKDVTLVKADVEENYSDYVIGQAAYDTANAWAQITGDQGMPGPEMSNLLIGRNGMTIGYILDRYELTQDQKSELYQTLDEIADTYGYESGYSDDTLWRGSLFDSDVYGHPVAGSGKLVIGSEEDYSSVPYMNNGVGAEGLQTSSVIEFQGADLEFNLENCKVAYEGKTDDFNYLIASESAANGVVNFTACEDLTGIIWNQGLGENKFSNGGVNQGSAGPQQTDASEQSGSTILVQFDASSWTGNFADGSNGLWDVEGLSYTDAEGTQTSRNGNYYNNEANWGITAVFTNKSIWNVSSDSYIGTLTIEDGSEIQAPEGHTLEIYTDVDDVNQLGKSVDSLQAGTYNRVVIIVK